MLARTPVATHVRRVDGDPLATALGRAAEAVALPVRPGEERLVTGAGVDALGEYTGFDVVDVLAAEKAEGAPGEVISLPFSIEGRVVRGLLAGFGDGSPQAYRRAGAAVARRVRGVATAVVGLGAWSARPGESGQAEPGPEELRAFVEGLLLASYAFRLTSETSHPAPAREVHLALPGAAGATSNAGAAPELDAALQRAEITARAVALARDLVNTPAETKSPQWLAEQAEAMSAESGLRCRVRDEDELRAAGFGGILAVGAGSAQPPRFIELAYEPEDAREHVVLVGKGITFDSGGLSLKPNDNMKLMKTDMAGGAAVIAALGALRALSVPYRVTGLVPAAENMPGGSAQRPGDVITHYGGRTVEVLNTDAEGRLVLADALAYASARLQPDTVVDLATLTGAATVALGRTHGALYATNDALADALVAAGKSGGDPLWRLPLVDDYRDALESTVADLAHIARKGYSAGSVIAALFLREFVDGPRWAHLDIAGPARSTSDEHELTKGGTGFGVRALLRWLAMPALG